MIRSKREKKICFPNPIKAVFPCGITFVVLLLLWAFYPVTPAYSDNAKNTYLSADAYHKALRNNKKKRAYRDNWLFCITKYQDVYKNNPEGPWAAAGMYMTGKVYLELYQYSKKASDKNQAMDLFQRVKNNYPKSRYSKHAANELLKRGPQRIKVKKRRFEKNFPKKIKKKPIIKPVKTAKKHKPRVLSKPVTPVHHKNVAITNLRYWTNPSYTRIVIDANNTIDYSHHLLKSDTSLKKPQRLYLDFSNCSLTNGSKKQIPINDNLLKNVRAAQYSKDSVRVVIDIKSFKDYKVFSLKNPFRVVVDIWGKSSKVPHYASKGTASISVKKPSGSPSKATPGALAKQLSLGVKRIIIDPGHGGKDTGAPGYRKGVYEKNVALDLAKRLAAKIRSKLKCEVMLTRKTDRFLSLEERTAFANTNNADLFISIHTNAAKNRRAHGIETYFLNLASDETSISVAARENATSTKNISDLQSILNDLMRNAKINESSRLAAYVQDSMYKGVKKRYSNVKNKGVKQAPFYVLLGAQMPSILLETSFISNPMECKRLMNSRYKDVLCDSIVKGIERYIRDTNVPM